MSVFNDELHQVTKSFPVEPQSRLNPTLSFNHGSGKLKVQQEKRCRICPSRDELSRHHLVPHSWFLKRKPDLRVLRNANANIVPLCASCHRVLDGVHDPVGRLQKRAALRAALHSNEMAFILQVRGRPWLDHHYPKHP